MLCPSSTWAGLRELLREIIAINKILEKYKDLPSDDVKMLKDTIRQNQSDIPCNLLNTYSKLYLPDTDGPWQKDTTVLTTSSTRLDDNIYEKLKGEYIHEELSPLIIKTYLQKMMMS